MSQTFKGVLIEVNADKSIKIYYYCNKISLLLILIELGRVSSMCCSIELLGFDA